MTRSFTATATENGASQVVALNLTNLFVLVLLKALIFAAGSLGAGAWKGGFARSNEEEGKWLSDEEVLLFGSYLAGDGGCLKLAACRGPREAQKYAEAGSLVMRALKMLEVEPGEGYRAALGELEEAVGYGTSGMDCRRYKCGGSNVK